MESANNRWCKSWQWTKLWMWIWCLARFLERCFCSIAVGDFQNSITKRYLRINLGSLTPMVNRKHLHHGLFLCSAHLGWAGLNISCAVNQVTRFYPWPLSLPHLSASVPQQGSKRWHDVRQGKQSVPVPQATSMHGQSCKHKYSVISAMNCSSCRVHHLLRSLLWPGGAAQRAGGITSWLM